MPSLEIACRALLFDCDGVLVDSRETAEQAWTTWARTYHLDPKEVLDGLHGRRSRETVERHVARRDRRAALALIEETELATAKWTWPIEGGVELLSDAINNSAVVTSASKQLTSERLRAAGYPPPRLIIAAGDVRHGKPSPEGYLRAATQLDVPINECVILEDSDTGVAAARAAGVAQVIIVGPAVEPHTNEIQVNDLRQLRWSGSGLIVTHP